MGTDQRQWSCHSCQGSRHFSEGTAGWYVGPGLGVGLWSLWGQCPRQQLLGHSGPSMVKGSPQAVSSNPGRLAEAVGGGGLGPVLPAVPWPSHHSSGAAAAPACSRRLLPGAHALPGQRRPDWLGRPTLLTHFSKSQCSQPSKESPGRRGVCCAWPQKLPPTPPRWGL